MAEDTMSLCDIGKRYYRALDTHAYDDLNALLSPDFTQYRPDRTFDNKASFIEFMRTGRPEKETKHDIEEWYLSLNTEDTQPQNISARGTLSSHTGDPLFAFVDIMAIDEADRIENLWTYTQ